MEQISLVQISKTRVSTKSIATVIIDEVTYEVPFIVTDFMNGDTDFRFITKCLERDEETKKAVCKAICDAYFQSIEKESEKVI
jgi:hypothetical protein